MLKIQKYAAIDIGSNAVRLLISNIIEQNDKCVVFKKNSLVRVPIRLGADVFINGKIMKRKKLSGIVRQNYDNIYINMNGGFSGYLSSLRYFNYALGSFEISTLVSNGPSLKMESSNIAQSKPKYLSSKWFFSESSPTFN